MCFFKGKFLFFCVLVYNIMVLYLDFNVVLLILMFILILLMKVMFVFFINLI